MKKIAAITMVRDDDFFLRKWVDYYGKEIGRDHLYILFDGEDQKVPEFCSDLHTFVHKRLSKDIIVGERMRMDLLSNKAKELFEKEGYEIVIGVDCDEFIVVDPKLNKSLAGFLSEQEIEITISPLGIDLGQHLEKESEIDPDKKFLQQRSFGYLSSSYTKSSIITKPVRWDIGFYSVRGHNFHIVDHLYLLHFGCLDMKRMRERFMNPDRIGGTSASHLSKRTKTINVVTNHEAKDFEKATATARKIQKWIRNFYSWNKPSMLGRIIVVQIPERFRDIL
ncbi:MAG: glycosyltransferase family 2 protein [Muribaculaceae bacterium]|nr:glycosyltransferase family 2 protein [Muribaculaceae bacterium]